MALPSFLIIGAAKSGTTSLWTYLRQHPEVFLPTNKEPNYFALADQPIPEPGPAAAGTLYDLLYSYCVSDWQEYVSLFGRANGQKAIGEASVRYLYQADTPRRIREAIPDVRLIAVLRDPVSRLYSHYCMNRQYGLEPLSLREAIEAEAGRRDHHWGYDWHYVRVGQYAPQIQRYLDTFGRDQVKVVVYDDFVARPLQVFQEICDHIGVEARFVPDMSGREKVPYLPRLVALDRLLNHPGRGGNRRGLLTRRFGRSFVERLDSWNRRPVPRLDPGLRENLRDHFRADIDQLSRLLGRDLPW